MSDLLHGKKIIITREEKGSKVFSNKLLEFGAIPIEVPLLKISCKNQADNDQKLATFSTYEWIIFTSANGVECFFEMMKEQSVTLIKQLSQLKIAVVGHKTEDCLKCYGLSADFIPSTYNAETLAREFLRDNEKVGKVLLVRGNLSRDTLPIEFGKAGIVYDSMVVYETVYHLENRILLNQVITSDYDFITFTSPSSVDAFYKMADDTITTGPIVCIGTTTEDRAIELGFKQILAPNNEYTIDGMIRCMIDYISKGER
ncbi:uroporphyrinogen-III synthase [Oceanobacillus bengalensis]|uniref:Uroporphyrinogen-III synthase n=1 Tax=Oceanobacillus bengalensis TaxID=1435466 RepID=A0A494Z5X6_9BACI|nr:uroporphyrinogen-III synthase [Oceanobacillus bengalensis]RKQ17952.1 uroporphyrinogen-III synthase [Oceanobacillus bengalensis]